MATAVLTIDKTQVQPHLQTLTSAVQDMRQLGGAVQDAIGKVQLSAQVGGTPGTVTFTANAAVLIDALNNLKAKIIQAENEAAQAIALLEAGLTVTVTQVG